MAASLTQHTMDYQEVEWNGHDVIKLLKRLSMKQCIEYLVVGFLKQNTRKNQYDMYPLDIQQLNAKYLGFISFIRFKSGLINKESTKLMNEYHAKLITNKRSTLLIDLPIPVHDNEINIKWYLKIHAKGLSNGHYFIGIVYDKYKHFEETVWIKTSKGWHANTKQQTDIYGICGNPIDVDTEVALGTIVCNGLKGQTLIQSAGYEQYIKIGEKNYQNDDIVECHYDGKLKQFTLSKATGIKQLICSFELQTPSNSVKYWYPALSLRDKDDYIEIIQNLSQ